MTGHKTYATPLGLYCHTTDVDCKTKYKSRLNTAHKILNPASETGDLEVDAAVNAELLSTGKFEVMDAEVCMYVCTYAICTHTCVCVCVCVCVRARVRVTLCSPVHLFSKARV